MNCRFSREMLALHVEGDLPDASAAATVRHLAGCEECRRFLEELRASQALMKSVRRETVDFSECSAMRREVMRAISERPGALGWRLRIERAIALGLRPSYGMAAVLLVGIVSVSVLAQIRPATHQGFSSAGLEGADTMERPEAYRNWILRQVADRLTVSISTRRAIGSTRKREYFQRAPCSSGRRVHEAVARGPAYDLVHASGVPQGQHEVRGWLGLL